MKYIKRSISFLLALVMVAGLFPAVPFTVSAEARDSEHFSQDGDTCTIHDAAGWDLFCDLLAEGETFVGKTVKLDADVGTAAAPVTRMAGVIGDNAVPFCGVFDGGGYTLYFSNTAVDDNYIAPFRYVAGSSAAHACIHDLSVNTTISSTGYRHLCGLIALTKGYVDVYDCDAEIDISCAASAENTDLYPAGIVSQVSSDSGGTVTVTGCTVTGTITSGGKYAASLVSIVQGKATVRNCVGGVVIQSTVNGDGTHGGLMGVTASNSTTTIEGCVFNGKLLTVGENDTGNCGGILGWKNANVTIKNCLYAPAAIGDGEREVVAGSGDYPSGTFYRGNAPTITNCYYIRTLGTPQATRGCAVTEGDYVSVDYGTMTSLYSIPDITVYENGMFYHGKLYCGEGTSLPLSYEPRAGYSFTGFQVNGSPLNGSTLTMPAEDVTVTATYAANDYHITIDYDPQYGEVYAVINDMSGTTAHVGDAVALYIYPETGYELDTLTITDENGDPVPVTDKSFTMPASDVTVTVTFCLGNYAIIMDQSIQNGTVSATVNNEPASTAKMGELVTLTAVPDPGWELDSYQVMDAGEHPVPVQDDHFTMPGVAVFVNATFRPLDLAITIDSQIQHGSVSAAVNDQPAATAHVGDRVTLTVTEDSGYSINALTVTDANNEAVPVNCIGSNTWIFDMPASGVTVAASFRANAYAIIPGSFQHGSVTASVDGETVCSAHYGELVTLTVTPDTGWSLDVLTVTDANNNAVTLTANGTNTWTFPMPASDVSVAASFAQNDYSILVDDAIQHGSVTVSQATAHYGDTVTLTAAPDTGWSLASVAVVDASGDVVSLTGSGTDSWTFTMPASDVSVTAAFAAVDYSITIADVTNGSVTASVNNAPATAAHYGDLVTLAAAPDSSYRLESLAVTDANGEAVALTDNGTDAWTFVMPAGQVTVTASFVKLYPVVITENIPNGSVTANVTEAAAGDVVTLTAAPEQGFVLVENGLMVNNWHGYDPAVTNSQFVMPASGVTVTACFLPPAKTVSYIDETGAEQTVNAYPLTENAGILPGGWYVAEGEIERSENLELHHTEDICLILADGCSLTITGGDPITGGGSDLYIYGQAGQSGCLTVTGEVCGISVGALWVSGGRIKASAGDSAIECQNAAFTMYAGTVEAFGVGDYQNYGIHATNDYIYGGTVTAQASGMGIYGTGEVVISGGSVTALCGADGIGGIAVHDAGSTIELGWTNPTDSIYTNSFSAFYDDTFQMRVTDGQALKYLDGSGKHFLSGTLTEDEISRIAGKTLLPAELWTVNLADISDGFLTADTSAAEAGDTVTVVFNGDSNMEASLSVTDADGNAVPVTELSPKRCSFTMPASDVTVTATVTVYYNVTVVAPVNGSLTASVTRAAVGELVTLTAAPDQGFVLAENGLIVLADDYFSPELLPVSNDQFTMPRRNVIVAAAFLPAAKSVRYIDETGTEQTVMAYPLTEGVSYLPGGWYVAEGDLNLLEPLTFTDDARLILADGCRMTVSSASAVLAMEDLSFYGQAGQTGSFAAKAPQSSHFAFIINECVTVNGDLTVCGGNVIAASDGERCVWVGNDITVLRGTLEAVGNVGGPAKNGILCDSFIVSGGAVSAEGREYGLKTYVGCRISGGNVSFSGGSGGILDQGAGIELGWTEPTDSIYASSYSGSVTVAEDTTFVNDDDPPMMISEGPVEDLSLIDGFTLLPPGGSFVIHVLKTGTGTVLCPATAFQGEIVNLTVIPTGSSALSALRLTDAAGNELTLSDDGNNSWSFTMPADHVTLEIRFEELYHVYIDSGIPHGTVTADKTWAAPGELVTLTCTPDAGYVLVENSVMLSDASYNYVSVYDDQFPMPANNVSVTVAFLKAPKSVSYVDETGRARTAMAYPLEEDVTLLPGGWYVAEGALNFGEFSFYGTTPANLILADGCQMTVEPAWGVFCGEELSIYGQSGQTGTLSIHGGDASLYMYADVFVCGGRLELSGNSYGLRCDNTIWIYGGTMEATATGSSGSGIMGYRVCILGGTVNASGAAGIAAYQNIEFYGGNVSAVGSDGGIWPGEETLLSWTDPTDSIYASSYRNSVTVVDGMSFVTDDDPPVTIPEGPVDDLSLIDGKTLTPLYETHSITVLEVNGNGTVTADKQEAYPGETVTLTAAPAQGFVLIRNGLLVETELGSVLPVTNGQFTMPASDVTVMAAFLPAEKEVSYVDYEGKERTHLAYPLAEGTVVLPGGWYVAEDALSLSGGLSFRGQQDACLILADGCVLNVSGGPAALEAEDDLRVFGQSGQTGSLIADGGMYGILARGDLYLCGGSVSASGDIVCIECWDSIVVFDAAVDANGSGAGSAQYGIRGNYCDVEGGSVLAQGSVGGVCMQDRFRFVCGSLWAAGGEYGLASENGVTLSWRELTDSVYVSSYQCGVSVAGGKSFVTDDDPPVVIPAGMVEDLDLINGRTLTPENLPHSVNIWSEIAHGALTADKETAMAGEIVTLTAVPDAGYVLAENGLLVIGDDGVTVPVTNGQFVMPACDVTATATFLRPAKSVSYLDENGLEQTVLAYPLDEDVTYLPGGWYVAEGDVTRNEPLGFVGSAAVHLILADGCRLSAGEDASCVVYSDPDLRFYGQSGQTGSLLASYGNMGVYAQSDLLICGGVITFDVQNAIYCSGDLRIVGGTISIGADPEGSTQYGLCGDTIHITGGTVNARAEYYGICSRNGFWYSGGNVVAVGDSEGIYDEYGIDLSWTGPTDSIYASSWYGYVSVAEGKSFVTDDDPSVTIPEGPVDDLSVINGRTLTPYVPNGYYLIGPDWTLGAIDDNKVFTVNPFNNGEYMLSTTLAAGDEIKVVHVTNNAIDAWYPDGLDNQYTVDAAHSGEVTVYFKTVYDEAWAAFGGYIWIEAQSPAGPELDPNLAIFYSISVTAEIKSRFTFYKRNLNQYDDWYFEVSKLDADGNVIDTLRYGEGEEGTLSLLGSSVYAAVYTDINATEMGVDFVATIHAFDADGKEFYNNSDVLSLQRYFVDGLLSDETDAASKTMYADMLNYGAAVQKYFEYDLDHLVNENLETAAADALATYQTPGTAPATAENTESANIFSSVSFKNRIVLTATIRKPNTAESVSLQVTSTKDGSVKEIPDPTVTGSIYKYVINNIEINEMRVPFVLQILADGEPYGEPMTWSVEGYVKSVRDGGNAGETTLELMNTMLKYVDSAKIVFEQ